MVAGTAPEGKTRDKVPNNNNNNNARKRDPATSDNDQKANGHPVAVKESSLMVAVRIRPLRVATQTNDEKFDILRPVDKRMIVVLDPDDQKSYLDMVAQRTKEKRYMFDLVFGQEATNRDVYEGTVSKVVEDVVRGHNATMFAYGATGSGKTHTMVGTREDPGLMVLALEKVFQQLAEHQDGSDSFQVTCSYLEVYNEVIYDLLVPRSAALDVREAPGGGILVAGLKSLPVKDAHQIMDLLNQGNMRRKTESTSQNATSSRSHAVLEIIVQRTGRNQVQARTSVGKLALVDLAGSERAAETGNNGRKLRDGANINKSLLALANCINALGKAGGGHTMAYIPYRNSKLTRLLKDGLAGNSRTCMLATVSCANDAYFNTVNTLKYANRAKEIKTHIHANIGTVETHVVEYQRMIAELQLEVTSLRQEVAIRDAVGVSPTSSPRAAAQDPDEDSDEGRYLKHLGILYDQIGSNAEERVNLQRALFEVEDKNKSNRTEVAALNCDIEELRQAPKEARNPPHLAHLLKHRGEVLDAIADNEEYRRKLKADIAVNEETHRRLQRQLDEAVADGSVAADPTAGPGPASRKEVLLMATQQRMQGAQVLELQFQVAVRDAVIGEQKQALDVLWQVMEGLGIEQERVVKEAARMGVANLHALARMGDPSAHALAQQMRLHPLPPPSPAPASRGAPMTAIAGSPGTLGSGSPFAARRGHEPDTASPATAPAPGTSRFSTSRSWKSTLNPTKLFSAGESSSKLDDEGSSAASPSSGNHTAASTLDSHLPREQSPAGSGPSGPAGSPWRQLDSAETLFSGPMWSGQPTERRDGDLGGGGSEAAPSTAAREADHSETLQSLAALPTLDVHPLLSHSASQYYDYEAPEGAGGGGAEAVLRTPERRGSVERRPSTGVRSPSGMRTPERRMSGLRTPERRPSVTVQRSSEAEAQSAVVAVQMVGLAMAEGGGTQDQDLIQSHVLQIAPHQQPLQMRTTPLKAAHAAGPPVDDPLQSHDLGTRSSGDRPRPHGSSGSSNGGWSMGKYLKSFFNKKGSREKQYHETYAQYTAPYTPHTKTSPKTRSYFPSKK